jgi:uncharacterized protein (DUF2267 family)
VEELVKTVSQNAGISPEQAKSAITSVLDYLKEKLPMSIGSQLDGVIASGGPSITSAADAIRARLGGG